MVGDRAIRQGATFDWVTFLLKEDYSTWQGRGQIRDNYAEKAGKIKATFTVSLQYGSVTINGVSVLRTSVIPTLTALETEQLDWLTTGMRSPLGTEPFNPGKNCWLYDIEIHKADKVKRIVEGFVTVSPEVTR